MGFWSDNFGGGNSFSESVSNTFTPSDGASYVGGTLTYDSGNNSGSSVPTNSSGGYGSDDSGNSVYSGNADSNATNTAATSKIIVGAAPSKLKSALGFTTPLGIIGKISGWSNNIDPEKDTPKDLKTASGTTRKTYTNEDGFTYSYNFLGLPYEVTDVDGVATDSLAIPDNNGVTGYQRLAQEARNRGDNDGAAAILQEEEDNATEDEGSSAGDMSAEGILEMASAVGMVGSNADINEILADPAAYLAKNNMSLADLIEQNNVAIDPDAAGTTLDPTDPKYLLGESPAYTADTVDTTAVVDDVVATDAATYEASTTNDLIVGNEDATAEGITGTISDDNLVVAAEIDMQGAATGVNADGTTSEVGNALNDYAVQDISTIIDTSTIAGKLLAQKLGEGNYTDAKATILGQMEIISAEFKDSNGNPVIPPWAQGMARDVSRSMAFSGVSGTAATAAMSNAIMEATLGIADKEAQFFQTLTIENLDNRQEAIINKASVLAKFEVANLDNRQAALVQNAKAFLEMDLRNLDNEQQAEIFNKQAYIDSLFNDQAAENAARLFGAEQTNEMQMLYDKLAATVQMHNVSEINSNAQFNAGEINAASRFNAEVEDGRQRFYSEMQYNIDKVNASWRKEVATNNSNMMYDAYAADVKNSFDISQEGLNRMWDRVDSLLDYAFKGANAEADRDVRILMAEIQAQSNSSSGGSGFWGAIASIGGALAGNSSLFS